MSRNIYRRSKLSGTASSDLVKEGVDSLSELRASPIVDRLEKSLIYVKTELGLYAYHSDSTDPDDGSLTIAPAQGNGRWKKVSGAAPATLPSGNDGDILIYDGNTNTWVSTPLYPYRWIDPQELKTGQNLTVETKEEIRRGEVLLEYNSSITVDYDGEIYVTNGYTEAHRPDFHQSGVVRSYSSIPADSHLVVHSADHAFTIENGANLEVYGDLICLNFFNV